MRKVAAGNGRRRRNGDVITATIATEDRALDLGEQRTCVIEETTDAV